MSPRISVLRYLHLKMKMKHSNSFRPKRLFNFVSKKKNASPEFPNHLLSTVPSRPWRQPRFQWLPAARRPPDSRSRIREPFLQSYKPICTTGASLIKLRELMSKRQLKETRQLNNSLLYIGNAKIFLQSICLDLWPETGFQSNYFSPF